MEGGIRPRSRLHDDLSPRTVRARDVESEGPGSTLRTISYHKISHACCRNRNEGEFCTDDVDEIMNQASLPELAVETALV